jgi:hypothetical protein
VYSGAAMTMLPPTAFPNPLSEHDPGSGHGYGSGVIGMAFCPANMASAMMDGGAGGAGACTTLPLVGTLSKVYTYFTLKKPDPRVR